VRGALAVALEHDLHDAALRAYNNVIAGCWYEAKFREAVALIDEALEYARRTGERVWELVFLSGRQGNLGFLGRWDEALETAAAAEPYASTEFQRGLLLMVGLLHLWGGWPRLGERPEGRPRGVPRTSTGGRGRTDRLRPRRPHAPGNRSFEFGVRAEPSPIIQPVHGGTVDAQENGARVTADTLREGFSSTTYRRPARTI
jgi:hypothetical protein